MSSRYQYQYLLLAVSLPIAGALYFVSQVMRLSALCRSSLKVLAPFLGRLSIVPLLLVVNSQSATAAAKHYTESDSAQIGDSQDDDQVPDFDGADDISEDMVYQEFETIETSAPLPPMPANSRATSTESTSANREAQDERDETTNIRLMPSSIDPVSQVPLNTISPTTLKTFVEVVDLVRREYVEPVSDEALLNDAMSGMLTKLDSHAEFLDAEAFENLRAFTQGEVGEVGLQAEYQSASGHWVVTAVSPNSPAAKERIKVGDYLHQINKVKLTDSKNSNDIKQMLTGIAGTQVELVISRAGRSKRTITLQRNQTRELEIRARLQQGVAIVKLPVFQNNSRQNLLTQLAKLNAPVSGLIIDVRDNPGGVLESAVDIAGLFMSDKPVVQIVGRRGVERTLKTSAEAQLATLPVIILQNRYSASAAEVLASSLKTQRRAQVAGETSYGKGSVQSVIPVNDEQAIKLTVAHYLTADGQQIDDIGVAPDISLKGDEDSWEEQALTLMLAQERPQGISFVLQEAE